jgi:hypothetical protein
MEIEAPAPVMSLAVSDRRIALETVQAGKKYVNCRAGRSRFLQSGYKQVFDEKTGTPA